MKEQLISFETAKLAKEKGFNFPVLFAWIEILNKESSRFGETKCRQVNASQLFDNECYAPTQSLLQKWLREEHKIFVTPSIEIYNLTYGYEVYKHTQSDEEIQDNIITYDDNTDNWDIETYEQALEKGLQEALNLIK